MYRSLKVSHHTQVLQSLPVMFCRCCGLTKARMAGFQDLQLWVEFTKVAATDLGQNLSLSWARLPVVKVLYITGLS